MNDLSTYRIGNNVLYEGRIIKLNADGLKNTKYVSPIPLDKVYFERMKMKVFLGDDHCPSYMFNTSEDDGIVVIFHKKKTIVLEHVSKIEYPFIKHVHEVQNLIEDKRKELTLVHSSTTLGSTFINSNENEEKSIT